VVNVRDDAKVPDVLGIHLAVSPGIQIGGKRRKK